MLIRILNTTFGLVVNGIVKPKSPADPPFEVDDELGNRLVRDGIAENVGGAYAELSEEAEEPDEIAETADESGDFSIPKYSEETSKADLQAIAKEYGVAVSATATKQDIIKSLDDFFADALSDTEE